MNAFNWSLLLLLGFSSCNLFDNEDLNLSPEKDFLVLSSSSTGVSYHTNVLLVDTEVDTLNSIRILSGTNSLINVEDHIWAFEKYSNSSLDEIKIYDDKNFNLTKRKNVDIERALHYHDGFIYNLKNDGLDKLGVENLDKRDSLSFTFGAQKFKFYNSFMLVQESDTSLQLLNLENLELIDVISFSNPIFTFEIDDGFISIVVGTTTDFDVFTSYIDNTSQFVEVNIDNNIHKNIRFDDRVVGFLDGRILLQTNSVLYIGNDASTIKVEDKISSSGNTFFLNQYKNQIVLTGNVIRVYDSDRSLFNSINYSDFSTDPVFDVFFLD